MAVQTQVKTCFSQVKLPCCHILPLGTEEERGISQWRKHIRGEYHRQEEHDDNEASNEAVDKARSSSFECYDLPCCMSFIRRCTLFKFVPLCPTFLVNMKHGQTANDLEANGNQGAAYEAVDEPSADVESPI